MLISLDDLQSTLNVDLTNPEGQTTATILIQSAQGWLSSALGFPVEETSVTTYFDGEYQLLWMPTGAPVSNLVLATFDSLANSYTTINSTLVRNSGSNAVSCTQVFPCGYKVVRATYTTGWTTLNIPADLKQVLIDMVGLKLQAIANFSGTDATSTSNDIPITGALKRVQSDSYSEEYSTAQADAYWKSKANQLASSIGDALPPGIMEVVMRYTRSFAL